jgi:uncharacterized protein YecE (DUF72 family)
MIGVGRFILKACQSANGAREIYAFYNNDVNASAPRNALTLPAMIAE